MASRDITLGIKEADRWAIVAAVVAKRVKWCEAAERLGLTDLQERRQVARFGLDGPGGLGSRGEGSAPAVR